MSLFGTSSEFMPFMNSLLATPPDQLPKPTIPIYSPSKGRANSVKTPETLRALGLDCTLVVEPQDYQPYIDAGHQVISLDKNDQGIAYVRQFIKEQATSAYHWQLDDDIKGFCSWISGKREKVETWYPFAVAEAITKEYSFGGLCLALDTFAFSLVGTPYRLNKQIYGCMLLNSKSPAEFLPGIVEDTDFSLQLLFGGMSTIALQVFSFKVPPNGSNTGGNNTAYHSGALTRRQETLCAKYPGHFVMEDKNGSTRVKPSKIWSKFSVEPTKVIND